VTDFRQLFLVPAAAGLGTALLLLFFFHPRAKADEMQPKESVTRV
jgi:hypothetical protein